MGHHLLWIQPAKLVIGLKVLYAIDLINILALSIPKLAILFLYKRLFIISKLTNHAIKGATYAVYFFIIVLEAIAIFQWRTNLRRFQNRAEEFTSMYRQYGCIDLGNRTQYHD
ncbi:uncharacterized protein EAF02_009390 [Botrytis sinoallii]|uniref:uncharacterized protein n=1 Tax=Botrytis sinoallii TaxID=1463999 RepID=UPI0018FF14A0|nr:uncharacterized protein EAF02_009390 [Botrytis sinoallii]KAF7870200.1 hypothetical protein EAF02_009390 [Botrytis sinoallii]